MNHDLWHERLALELYGELEPAEQAALDAHLAQCEPCREFRASLRSGLGRLAGCEDELEASLARLRGAFDRPQRSSNVSWLAIAAALLVGLGLGFAVSRSTAVPSRSADSDSVAQREPSAPPPRARTGGELAQLGSLVASRSRR